MTTKQIRSTPFILLGIFASMLLLCNLQSVNGLTTPISMTDGTHDVIHVTGSTGYRTGVTFDDVDIVAVSATSQLVSFSILGDFGNWNTSFAGLIYFFDSPINILSSSLPYPFYSVQFMNYSGNIRAFLAYSVALFETYFWTGSGWTSMVGTALDISISISTSTIMVNVPLGVSGSGYPTDGYEIPDGVHIMGQAQFSGYDDAYLDTVPDLLGGGDDAIPGYDVILVGAVIGIVTLLVVKKRYTKK